MIDALKRFAKILRAISKIIPVIIDILADFADDGKRNNSNISGSAESGPAGTDTTTK